MYNMKETWPGIQNGIPLGTEFDLKQSTFKFWDKICPKKRFQRQDLRKKPAKFRISTLEYPCVLNFIWNKVLWSFGTNLA